MARHRFEAKEGKCKNANEKLSFCPGTLVLLQGIGRLRERLRPGGVCLGPSHLLSGGSD